MISSSSSSSSSSLTVAGNQRLCFKSCPSTAARERDAREESNAVGSAHHWKAMHHRLKEQNVSARPPGGEMTTDESCPCLAVERTTSPLSI